MADVVTLEEAVTQRGPYAVWELMTEEEQRAAAAALWQKADRTSRAGVEMALAAEPGAGVDQRDRLGADVGETLQRVAAAQRASRNAGE